VTLTRGEPELGVGSVLVSNKIGTLLAAIADYVSARPLRAVRCAPLSASNCARSRESCRSLWKPGAGIVSLAPVRSTNDWSEAKFGDQDLDFGEVKGQQHVKRAVEVAAAGGPPKRLNGSDVDLGSGVQPGPILLARRAPEAAQRFGGWP
jgi:hypothetical protein